MGSLSKKFLSPNIKQSKVSAKKPWNLKSFNKSRTFKIVLIKSRNLFNRIRGSCGMILLPLSHELQLKFECRDGGFLGESVALLLSF